MKTTLLSSSLTVRSGAPRFTVVRNQHSRQVRYAVTARSEQLVLGIETSCDETAVAIVTSKGEVLGEAIATQAEVHAPYGGVVPKLAQEAHAAAIDRITEQAFVQAGITPRDLSAVAYTLGPGLGLCLRVGVLKARHLSGEYGLPLIPVHHMEAHALVARCPAAGSGSVRFPFLVLLLSGGHNLLLLVTGVGQYVQLGTTVDDALGEAYDKVARMLGLQAAGGPALEALARQGDPLKYKFVIPMKKYATCDFSFAGLKTNLRMACELHLKDPYQEGVQQVAANLAASFQYTAVKHVTEKLRRGIAWCREDESSSGVGPEGAVRQLVVAGGVAANQYLRQQLKEVAESAGLELVLPPPRWCTDNGVMVAWAGVERLQAGLGVEPPPAWPPPVLPEGEDEWVELRARWPLTTRLHPRCPPLQELRSVRKMRLGLSLTEMTEAELAARASSLLVHDTAIDAQGVTMS